MILRDQHYDVSITLILLHLVEPIRIIFVIDLTLLEDHLLIAFLQVLLGQVFNCPFLVAHKQLVTGQDRDHVQLTPIIIDSTPKAEHEDFCFRSQA